MSASTNMRAIRGRLLWFDDDPALTGDDAATRYIGMAVSLRRTVSSVPPAKPQTF